MFFFCHMLMSHGTKKILTQTTHMAFDILADEGTIYN